jgi:hypothetical protein
MNKELKPKIEELFRWTGTVEIKDNEGEVVETVYQRVVGDADIQRARLEALKASKLMRKALKNKESDEAIINLPLDDDYTKEELITLIIFSRYSIFRQQAEYRTQEKKIKEPKSDATLEEQENFIENVEQARADYELGVNEDIKKQIEKYEEELKAKTVEELFDIYLKEHSEIVCRLKMIEVFDEFATFFGSFADAKHKERRFEDIESFRDLAPRIKNILMENYKKLELGLSEVKK